MFLGQQGLGPLKGVDRTLSRECLQGMRLDLHRLNHCRIGILAEEQFRHGEISPESGSLRFAFCQASDLSPVSTIPERIIEKLIQQAAEQESEMPQQIAGKEK